jgi:hypothetical protein
MMGAMALRLGFFKLIMVLLGPITCLLLAASAAQAEKYSPDHPVVQEMVNKAVAYLANGKNRGTVTVQSAAGTEMLIAYTIYKVEGDAENPLVAQAIRNAKNYVDTTTSASRYPNKAIYEIALACMLLASVDVDTYSPQLIKARDFLLRVQQASGGFGYIDGSHKDTAADISQTQYAMLAFWTMSQSGIEVPEDRIARIVQYLIDAQIKDPSMPTSHGGWAYHWDPTASNNERYTTHSRVACGLSAVLIAGDTLGIYRNRLAQSDDEEDLVPAAFKRVIPESEKPKKGSNFDRAKIDSVVNLGLLYNRNNAYAQQSWHYYYLYSVERFESFLEIAAGKQNKSPDWYNAEVERLRESQGKGGSWGASDAKDFDTTLGPDVSTCFAVLFLIRSTQKSIGDLKEGVVRGWAELPQDISAVTMVNGKPVNKSEATSIDDALKMLEDDKQSQGEDKLVADKIVFAGDPGQRKDQLNRFARLLRSRDYQARRIAAKVLGRSDDMEVVPELIFALSDPDTTVARNAETSLRLISRQLDRYHIPKEGAVTDQNRIVAKREWQTWFLSMRPDYIFVE